MGVQPGALEAGLVPANKTTDTTKPVSTINAPSGTPTVGQAVTITGAASDVGGVVAAVEVSTDNGTSWHRANGDETWSYTFVPATGGSYAIRSRAVDDSVNLETPGAGRTLTVAGPAYAGVFTPTAKPVIDIARDPSSVELGVKIQPSVSGTIGGVRFYKGPGNTGTHTGTLWSSTGTQLATATFANESATGWQTVTFASPVSVTAGATYVASYHTSGGAYSADANFFTTSVTNGSITAPSSAAAGGNGVFRYGAATVFPNQTFQNQNYWVDVLFSPGTVGPNQPPVAVNDSGFTTPRGTPTTIPTSALLANDTDPNGDSLTVSSVANATNGSAVLNANSTITFTPTASYTGPASFSYTVSDGHSGTASANVSLTVTPPGTAVSLFSPTSAPAAAANDASQVELGMKFQASTAGTISGLRYYREPGDAGTHTGTLWSSTGTQLATATFTGETASGWQTVNFANPVSITSGTTYVASYHSNGFYGANSNYFGAAVTNGPLTAPSSASSGGNGVYQLWHPRLPEPVVPGFELLGGCLVQPGGGNA